MSRLFRKILLLLLAGFIILLIGYFPLVVYGIRQLKGQLSIINNSVPLSDYIEENPKDTIYTPKLKYLDVVRQYAMDSLGLHSSENYSSFYNHGSKPLMWVVTACKPFSLEPATWDFPFLGEVSYKGFFDETLAIEEARKWVLKGYDTDIYNPSAWSTLGFLNDPVLSGMLNRGPGQLSELIIHELTHATVFVSENIDYNENIATFIGEQGAEEFLKMHFGETSAEVKRYTNYLTDHDIYAKHLLHGAERLDSLYRSFHDNMPAKEKAIKKYRLIAQIMLEINYLPLKEVDRFRFDFRKNKLPGNADFMAYIRYRKDQTELQHKLNSNYNGDLRKMIADLANSSVSE